MSVGQTEAHEIVKAQRYREAWEHRIAYRANQLRQLSGQPGEFERMWANYRKVYDPTNYIAEEELVEFFTPFDVEDPGGISSSPIRLPNAIQSRRREPGYAAF